MADLSPAALAHTAALAATAAPAAPLSFPSLSAEAPGIPLAGLVLAAGFSRRMGCPKLLLPWQGRPLIAAVLDAALGTGLAPLLAVYGPHSAPELLQVLDSCPGLHRVCAQEAASGQAASLGAGLKAVLALESPHAPVQGLCVFLGDQPLLRAAHVRQLVQAFARQPHCFAVPLGRPSLGLTANEKGEEKGAGPWRRGNPVIIPRCFFSAVMALQGDCGARPLLAACPEKVQEVPMADDAVLRDVDSPEDYESLKNSPCPPLPSGAGNGIVSL